MPKQQHVLRVAVGKPGELFVPVWRFWTYGGSAYFSVRVLGWLFKCSYHPATGTHKSAIWTAAFTRESGHSIPETGSRRAKTWPRLPPFKPGWYRGPVISIPRLRDLRYDLPVPPSEDDAMTDVVWVDPPGLGRERFLTTFLTDGRDDLEPIELGEHDEPVGSLPMTDGWRFSVLTTERAHPPGQEGGIRHLRRERWGLNGPVSQGTVSGSILWVTTSPEGPPLFVEVVLGSDNFYEDAGT